MSACFPAAMAIAAALAASPPGGTCQECHAGLDSDLAKPAEAFAEDVHAQRGLGCTACHGGDAASDDAEVSMSRARGFRGKPAPRDVPRLCGGCHGDPAFIKRFAPNLPTDQLSRYATSRHAKELAKGNSRAAVCSSCHHAHGILSTKDARSPVYPTRVVATCGTCHARPNGSGPVEQWRRSVHAKLLEAGDLSAPTCPRCHGSHGAAPPGIASVPAVCGQCHQRNMQLFRASPHFAAFEAASIGACEACHGNHEVLHPADEWLGIGEGTVCGKCHASGDAGGTTADGMKRALDASTGLMRDAESRVDAARSRGMLMADAEVALQGAHEQIIEARTLVHTSVAAQVVEKTSAADAGSRKALAEAARAFAEIRYRRTGLLIALGLILLAIVALVLKIREVDARRSGEARR